MVVTDWISYIALLCSLSSLWLSIRSFRRDRYLLRFEGFVLSTTGAQDFTFQICVRITNQGRRPISVVDIYFRTDPSRNDFPILKPIHGLAADSVHPIQLAENETRLFVSKFMTCAQMLELAQTIDVHINDSVGKQYRVAIANEAYDETEYPAS